MKKRGSVGQGRRRSPRRSNRLNGTARRCRSRGPAEFTNEFDINWKWRLWACRVWRGPRAVTWLARIFGSDDSRVVCLETSLRLYLCISLGSGEVRVFAVFHRASFLGLTPYYTAFSMKS